MGPLAKAIDEIKFTIPIEVLNEAFKNQNEWRQAPVSLDEKIMTKVIRPRVLVDCNLVGGITLVIPIYDLTPDQVDDTTVVYKIPKELTQNRSIVSVLSVGYTQRGFGLAGGINSPMVSITPNNMNDIMQAAQRVGDAVSTIPMISNANVTLIGENLVLVKTPFRTATIQSLRCLVSNDENLNNISPRSYHNLAQLCILAVKSFIYRTMLIRIDQAYLQGGQELGAMKSYIETLSDSEENYRTFLKEVWSPTAFMNDVPSYDRLLRLQVNPGL